MNHYNPIGLENSKKGRRKSDSDISDIWSESLFLILVSLQFCHFPHRPYKILWVTESVSTRKF